MVAHGLITGMLFFIAGSVKDRFHTLEIKRLGGLLLQAPRHGLDARLLLHGVAWACPAWPGSGASSRRSSRPTSRAPASTTPLFRVYMVIAAIGTIFAAGYLLWLLQRVAFGTPTEEFGDEHIHDMHLTDYIAWTPMIVLIVVLGVYPNLHLQHDRRSGERTRSVALGR